jgi:threonine aldolase
MTQVSHPTPPGNRSVTGISAATWDSILQPVALLAVFGAAVLQSTEAAQNWPYGWTAVFVGLSMLCLGFGAGMLFYQRRQRAEAAMLRDDYAELSARARALSAKMDDLIKRKQSSQL